MQTAKKADTKGQAGRSKNAERQSDDPENRGAQTCAHRGMLGMAANTSAGGNVLTFIRKWGCQGGEDTLGFGKEQRQGVETQLGGHRHRWGTLNKAATRSTNTRLNFAEEASPFTWNQDFTGSIASGLLR